MVVSSHEIPFSYFMAANHSVVLSTFVLALCTNVIG